MHSGVYAEELRHEGAGGLGGEEAADDILGAENESGFREVYYDEEAAVGDLMGRRIETDCSCRL